MIFSAYGVEGELPLVFVLQPSLFIPHVHLMMSQLNL